MTREGEPFSAGAVAVRLRRFWLGEAMLRRVGVARPSRYRTWFAALDVETEKAVRNTSGAASYAPHAAAHGVQKGDCLLLRLVVGGNYTAAEREELGWI